MAMGQSTAIRGSGFHCDPEVDVCYRTLDHLGWPGYRVGDNGTVWSCWYRSRKQLVMGPLWDQLLVTRVPRGYCFVTLCGHGKRRAFMVHRLVLCAFAGFPPDGMVCCHWDDSKANNALSNLRWGTKEDNAADATRNGKRPHGEGHWSAKLTAENVIKIRRLYSDGKFTQTEIAKMFGVIPVTVSNIITRRTWARI